MVIGINIPDEHADRVIMALSEMGDFDQVGPPLTRPQFAKRMIISWIKSQVREYEARTAAEAVDIT